MLKRKIINILVFSCFFFSCKHKYSSLLPKSPIYDGFMSISIDAVVKISNPNYKLASKSNKLEFFDMSGNILKCYFDFYDSNSTKNNTSYTKNRVVYNLVGIKQTSLKFTHNKSWESPTIKRTVEYRKCTFNVPPIREIHWTLNFAIMQDNIS